MAMEWNYPVELRREGGEVHAYCQDMPEAIAAGATDTDALREMREALAAAVRGRIKDGMELDPPRAAREGEHGVSLPGRLAAKASLYVAFKQSGLSKVALAAKIGRDESEVRRILDPDHGTKLDQLEEAAAGLGGRLVIAFEPA